MFMRVGQYILIFFCMVLTQMFLGCGTFDDSSSEVCFVGDSITRFWDLEHDFPESKINKHAVPGAILEDVAKWSIKDCENNSTVMLIGTNNLALGMQNDTLTENFLNDFVVKYIAQVKELKPSKFYAISILPRNFRHREAYSINTEIQKFNERIEAALKNSDINYKYIDIHEYFLDDDGKIHWDFFTDGLHLSKEGYELMSFKVRRAL